jgi:hypothetical protein
MSRRARHHGAIFAIPAKDKPVPVPGIVKSRFYETCKWLKVWFHDKIVQVRAKIVTSFLLIPAVVGRFL